MSHSVVVSPVFFSRKLVSEKKYLTKGKHTAKTILGLLYVALLKEKKGSLSFKNWFTSCKAFYFLSFYFSHFWFLVFQTATVYLITRIYCLPAGLFCRALTRGHLPAPVWGILLTPIIRGLRAFSLQLSIKRFTEWMMEKIVHTESLNHISYETTLWFTLLLKGLGVQNRKRERRKFQVFVCKIAVEGEWTVKQQVKMDRCVMRVRDICSLPLNEGLCFTVCFPASGWGFVLFSARVKCLMWLPSRTLNPRVWAYTAYPIQVYGSSYEN